MKGRSQGRTSERQAVYIFFATAEWENELSPPDDKRNIQKKKKKKKKT